MQQQTAQNQSNTLKDINFTAWQYRHAKKEYRFIAIDRLIRKNQHQEAPVHAN